MNLDTDYSSSITITKPMKLIYSIKLILNSQLSLKLFDSVIVIQDKINCNKIKLIYPNNAH